MIVKALEGIKKHVQNLCDGTEDIATIGAIEMCIDAALPLARLYKEAVEDYMPTLIAIAKTHAMQTYDEISGRRANEADAFLQQIEEMEK